MLLAQFIGSIGCLIGFGLQLSPIPAVIEGLRAMEIKSMTTTYFIIGIIQAILWLGFGLKIHDIIVYGPNVTCFVLFSIYLNIIIYIQKKYALFYQANLSFYILLYIVIKYFPTHACDSIASIICIAWQTANLETMKNALKFKDQAYINKLLSYISFVSFGFGATYSLFISAYIMLIPNIYGSLLNLTNLYIWYWAGGAFKDDSLVITILKIILRINGNVLEERLTNSSKKFECIDVIDSGIIDENDKNKFLNKINNF